MVKVLLVTASYGEGHNQAAHAVAEALEALGATPRIVDYTDWLHPAVRSLTKFTLLQGVQKVPSLYGLFYRSMSHIKPSSTFQRQIHHLGMPQLKAFLRSWNPDVVASTFPSPTGVVSELRRAGLTDVANAAIVTDYAFNGQWLAENVDGYFVPVDSAKDGFVQHGVSEHLIEVSGIPVRRRFSDEQARKLLQNRMQLRQEQELSTDQPLFLIMGGGAGLLGDPATWQHLVKRTNAQFVIICGNNLHLRKLFAPLASERVRVLGYVTNVEEWMAMADLIVTKAGGVTVTESLAMELPMLIYRPIPGQEVANARFATDSGVAELATNLTEAEAFLQLAVQERTCLDRMRSAARRQSSVRSAATRIATSLIEMANARSRGELPKDTVVRRKRRKTPTCSSGSYDLHEE